MSVQVPEIRLDQQLCFAVYATAHAFTRFYRPLLAELGVTYPQYLVLVVLWENDGRTVSDIGDLLHLDSGTLTPLLKRLEALGMVSRTRNPSDERQVIVGLTEQGRAAQQKARAFPGRILAASNCTADELATLRQSLFDLRDQLEAAAP